MSAAVPGSDDGGGPVSTWPESEVCGDWILPEVSTISFTGITELHVSDGVPSSCSMTGHAGPDSSHVWSPSSSGVYCINTDGSDFDTVLSIWDSACVAEIECNDEDGLTDLPAPTGGRSSAITFDADASMSYVLVVDGLKFNSYGNYVLNVVAGPCP